MTRLLYSLTTLLTLAATSMAQAGDPARSRTRIMQDGVPRRAWFICDAVNAPEIAVVGMRGPGGATPIRFFSKRGREPTGGTYIVGDGDPGAGQVHFPVRLNGKDVGSLHMVNPGMIEDANVGGALTPSFTSMQVGPHKLECRYGPGVRFLGFDGRRSFEVRIAPPIAFRVAPPPGTFIPDLSYESFDFDATPPVRQWGASRTTDSSASGGAERWRLGSDGAVIFRFRSPGAMSRSPGPERYRVVVPPADARYPARVEVLDNGKVTQSEPVTAWTFAPDPNRYVRAPLKAQLVWPRTDAPSCRKDLTGWGEQLGCLAQAMRRDGASAEAVTLAEELTASRETLAWAARVQSLGPVTIANVVMPLRANSNVVIALVKSSERDIWPDERELTPEDKARPDYQALLRRSPGVFAAAAAEIDGVQNMADGEVRVRTKQVMATCRACAPAGTLITAYDFNAAGRLLSAHVVAVK